MHAKMNTRLRVFLFFRAPFDLVPPTVFLRDHFLVLTPSDRVLTLCQNADFLFSLNHSQPVDERSLCSVKCFQDKCIGQVLLRLSEVGKGHA